MYYISIHALLAESDTWARGSRVTYVEFLSTLSLRRATRGIVLRNAGILFLSTLSLRRATSLNLPSRPIDKISIHALLAESDRVESFCATPGFYFYPRSPCGERPAWNRFAQRRDFISIHALLAESDEFKPPVKTHRQDFYPRSPCGERPWHLHCVFIFAGISIHALLAESDLMI